VIPGIDDRIVVAILSSLLTFLVTRLLDRVRAGEEVGQVARGIAVPLLRVARALDQNAALFVDALAANDDRLRAFYKLKPELVSSADLSEYSSRVRDNSKLRHELLECLRVALTHLFQVQGRYDDVRQLVEVSSAVRGESEGIGRLVDVARQRTHTALRDLRAVSPSDTRQLIDQFLREHQ